jgi:TonB family protein
MPPGQRDNPSSLTYPSGPATAENEPSISLDQVLDQVAQQACLATAATASAIALKRGEEIVCCATAGVNTPDLGVRLNTESGLSGTCVQTREAQYCEDTEIDPRVDAATCRRLQVRSVLVSPLLQGDELVGVFEIFSPLPQAFARHDLQNLQTLSQVLLDRLPSQSPPPPVTDLVVDVPVPMVKVAEPEAVPELGSRPLPASRPVVDADAEAEREFFAAPPKESPAPSRQSSLITSEMPAPSSHSAPVPGWGLPGPPAEAPLPGPKSSSEPAEPPTPVSIFSSPAAADRVRPRDWATGFLTFAVVALALLLGWMLGREGWRRAERAARANKTQAEAVTPPGAAAASPTQGAPSVRSAHTDTVPTAPPKNANTSPSVAPRTPHPAPPQPKSSTELDPTGGLVVYQDGKVIFQQTSPRRNSDASRTGATTATSTAPKQEEADSASPVQLSSQLASSYLAQRVEPVYPEQARQNHIQGDVVLDAVVGKDGTVQQVALASGDPALAAAARDAVRQWRFRPYQLEGKAVAFKTRVTVEFRLP